MKMFVFCTFLFFYGTSCTPSPRPKATLSDMFYKLKGNIVNAKPDNIVAVEYSFEKLHNLIESYPNDSIREKAITLYAQKDSISKHLKALNLAKSAEIEKEHKTTLKFDRQSYEKTLRNQFLDSGVDIKVKISGKESDNLTLTYILFNDVWSRKFETEGYFEKWQTMGFSRWSLSDGHDYNQVWRFKK